MLNFQKTPLIFFLLLFFAFTAFAQEQNSKIAAPTPINQLTIRERSAIVELNNNIYLIGGLNNQPETKIVGKKKTPAKEKSPKVFSTIEKVNQTTNQWEVISRLPVGLYDLAAVALNNKIYLIGGYNSSSTPVNTVYCFDPANNKLTKVAPLATARAASKAVAFDGQIYLVGGKNKTLLKDLLSYDPKVNMWKLLPSMISPREQVAVNIFENKLLVAGGKGLKNLALTTVESYDPKTQTWQQLPPLPLARVNASSLVISKTFYLIGGQTLNQSKLEPLTNIDFYDSSSKRWLTTTKFPIPNNLIAVAMVNKDIKLFTSDGKNSLFPINELAAINPNNDQGITANIKPVNNDSQQPKDQPKETPKQSTKPIQPPISSPNNQPSNRPSQPTTNQTPRSTPNKAPIIYQIEPQKLRVGEEVCFTPQIVDPENDRLILTCNLPNYIRYRISGSTICLQAISKNQSNITGYVVVQDSFGNKTSQAFNLEILENHRPILDYINDVTVYIGQSTEINIQARDSDSYIDPDQDGRIALSLIDGPNFVQLTDYGNGRGKLFINPSQNWNTANNRVTIEVYDFGSPSLRSQISFNLYIKQPNRPPIIDPIADIIIRSGETLRLPVNVYDPDGDQVRVQFNYSDGYYRNLIEYVTGFLVLRPVFDREGYFTATLTATDYFGNQSQESFYVKLIVNHAPTLDPINNVVVEENSSQQINIVARDADRNRDSNGDGYIRLRLKDAPNFVELYDQGYGQATLTIKPRSGDSGRDNRKDYQVVLEVSDNGNPSLSNTTSFNITVKSVNTPPIIRGLPNQLIRIRGGESYCADFNVSDPDNELVAVNVTSDQQRFINAGNASVCVNPSADFDGRITINIVARDSRGKETVGSFTVRSFVNRQPTFVQTIRDTSIEENKTLSLKVRATDPDSERDNNQDGRVDLSLVNPLPFITFRNDGQGNATLLINPVVGNAGSYTIEVLASDNGNPKLINTLRFQLTVTPSKTELSPSISGANFESMRLVIQGSNFSDKSIVEINGKVVSQIARQNEGRILVTGRRKDLFLQVGQNNIVVINGDKRSNSFSYYFEKPKGANDDE